MEKRVFRGDRLYKVTKWIVNLITIFCLIVGGLGLYKLEGNTIIYLNDYGKCLSEIDETFSQQSRANLGDLCGNYLDLIIDNKKEITTLLVIGIILPILFYGGKKSFQYLFPKQK